MAKRSKPDETALVPLVTAAEPVRRFDLRQAASRIGDSAKSSFESGLDATRASAGKAGAELKKAGTHMQRSADATAKAAGRVGHAAYHAVGDLNGDGKVDEADLKIARDTAGRVAASLSHEAGELGKSVARHEITKDAAAGAAIGALIAVPIPLVGPVAGAAFGAAVGMARGVVGSSMIEDVVGQVASGLRKPAPRSKSGARKNTIVKP